MRVSGQHPKGDRCEYLVFMSLILQSHFLYLGRIFLHEWGLLLIRVGGEMEISDMGESSKITGKDSLLWINFSHRMDYADYALILKD